MHHTLYIVYHILYNIHHISYYTSLKIQINILDLVELEPNTSWKHPNVIATKLHNFLLKKHVQDLQHNLIVYSKIYPMQSIYSINVHIDCKK
jgi:hypothetical protein